MLCRRVERSVNTDPIANFRHFLSSCVERKPQLVFNGFRAAMASSVVQLDIKWFETSQHCKANPARRYRSDMHPFKVIRSRDAIRNIPATILSDLVRWKIVSNKRQDHHD